jgi:uncharacterized protein with GYD domain
MPTYISLVQFTQQGIEKIKDSPASLDRAKQAIKMAGGEMKAYYLTMGEYDAVVIVEAPNDETYASMLLATATTGSIRTETLRAFTEEEYRKIVAGIP